MVQTSGRTGFEFESMVWTSVQTHSPRTCLPLIHCCYLFTDLLGCPVRKLCSLFSFFFCFLPCVFYLFVISYEFLFVDLIKKGGVGVGGQHVYTEWKMQTVAVILLFVSCHTDLRPVSLLHSTKYFVKRFASCVLYSSVFLLWCWFIELAEKFHLYWKHADSAWKREEDVQAKEPWNKINIIISLVHFSNFSFVPFEKVSLYWA